MSATDTAVIAARVTGVSAQRPRNPRGSRAVPVTLTPTERQQLEALARRYATAPESESAARVVRAQIVLLAAEGWQNKDIAARLRVRRELVGTWRGRFAREGLAGLDDRPPGRPRTKPAVVPSSPPADAAARPRRRAPAGTGALDVQVSPPPRRLARSAPSRPRARRRTARTSASTARQRLQRIRCGCRGCPWQSAAYPPDPTTGDPNPQALQAWTVHAQTSHLTQPATPRTLPNPSSSSRIAPHSKERRCPAAS